ncbi:MAG: MraY family glycosyltransferase, partial [Patescibacteria group bacterium]
FLGVVDDYQNTHPSSSYRLMENPVLRLFLLFTSVLPVILSGVMIYSVSNPLGGAINLNIFEIQTNYGILPVIPIFITAVWVVWLMNVLSWSNGVDGQFSGIVGIASIIIALLALRFEEIEPHHIQIATLAAISAGAAFGSVKFNWHPSRIMWGFGAMSAGFIIASLAILAQAKITVSVLIILIPFLDAFYTVVRRLARKKSPFRGDKGHLHHILLDRGWSVSKVALFYWLATAVFGIIGLLSPERMVFKVALIISGVVGFTLIIFNVSLTRREKRLDIKSSSPSL